MISTAKDLIVEKLDHSYAANGGRVQVLRQASFNVTQSEVVTITGSGASGKSTLLAVCGALLKPTSGIVKLDGSHLYTMPPDRRIAFRTKHIGFIFQATMLFPYLNVLDNVLLNKRAKKTDAKHWLGRLGLSDQLSNKPETLSQSEIQLCCLARAIAHQPSLLIADQPTRNLDPDQSGMVTEILREFASAGGKVLAATHEPEIVARSDRVMKLADGRVQVV